MINTVQLKEYFKDPIQNYIVVPIKYTIKETELIENLNIDKNTAFEYYGNKSNINNKILNKFLNNLGSNKDIDINILYNLIYKLINKICKASNFDFVWIRIKSTLPNNSFDLKRWHKDGSFFMNPPQRINQFKFVTILKGNGTLFYKDSKQINKIYNDNISKRNAEYASSTIKQTFDDEITMKYRKKLANSLKKIKYKQLNNVVGLIFRTGNYNNRNNLNDGLLHSEPRMDKSRFFISILPCSELEINELMERWNITDSTLIFPKNN